MSPRPCAAASSQPASLAADGLAADSSAEPACTWHQSNAFNGHARLSHGDAPTAACKLRAAPPGPAIFVSMSVNSVLAPLRADGRVGWYGTVVDAEAQHALRRREAGAAWGSRGLRQPGRRWAPLRSSYRPAGCCCVPSTHVGKLSWACGLGGIPAARMTAAHSVPKPRKPRNRPCTPALQCCNDRRPCPSPLPPNNNNNKKKD